MIIKERRMDMGQRFWGVIVSPLETFRAIGEDPRILVPALLVVGIYTLLAVLVLPEVKEFTADMIEKSGQALPPGGMQAAMRWTVISSIVAAAVIPPITWLVGAGLLALFNLFSVGQAKFKQLYAIAFFAWLPVFLGGVLRTGLVKSQGYESVSSIKTSLALLLPPSVDSGFLFAFLSAADIFVIWGLILLAIGGAAVMGKDSKQVGAYIIGIWLVFIAAMAYVSTIFMPAGV